ncbi:C1 family peptidase, partial [bacterium]|nr:C1 family peptidase [bacterium]
MSFRSTLSFTLIVLLTCVTVTSSAQERRYGAIRDASLPDWIKPAPPITPQDGWDDYVDLSPNFPPVGNQGGQGSCTAWAVAYYYKSYQEWQEYGWAYTDETRCSPAFIYNQINGGVDGGSSPSEAFQMLCENGAPPYGLMPYTDQNCTTLPSEEAFYAAIPYRSQETFYFPVHQDLEGLKAHLLNGNAATFAFTVYANFDNLSNFNNIYCLADINGDPRGGHAVCLCGFDDNLVTSDGVGAFKVANSWGASWGDAGYWWISYECFQSYFVTWEYAYYCTDRIDYNPTTLGIFRVNHSDRYSLAYTFGVGDTQSPTWSQSFFDYGGSHTPHPYPASNIIVDLTDAMPYLNQSSANDVYMSARDLRGWNGHSGQIIDFEVVQLEWPAVGEAEDLPVAIPDNGAFAYSELDLSVGVSTSISGTISGTLAASGNPYYVMGDLIVAEGSSLTIEPGTELIFFDHYKVDVGVDATFTADDVHFRPLISAVGWAGIRMDGSSSANSVQNCTFEYSKATGEGV